MPGFKHISPGHEIRHAPNALSRTDYVTDQMLNIACSKKWKIKLLNIDDLW